MAVRCFLVKKNAERSLLDATSGRCSWALKFVASRNEARCLTQRMTLEPRNEQNWASCCCLRGQKT